MTEQMGSDKDLADPGISVSKKIKKNTLTSICNTDLQSVKPMTKNEKLTDTTSDKTV